MGRWWSVGGGQSLVVASGQSVAGGAVAPIGGVGRFGSTAAVRCAELRSVPLAAPTSFQSQLEEIGGAPAILPHYQWNDLWMTNDEPG